MNSVLLRTLRAERARLERSLADCPAGSARRPNLVAKIERLSESIRSEIDGDASPTSSPDETPSR